jgi:hypothetical protein
MQQQGRCVGSQVRSWWRAVLVLTTVVCICERIGLAYKKITTGHMAMMERISDVATTDDNPAPTPHRSGIWYSFHLLRCTPTLTVVAAELESLQGVQLLSLTIGAIVRLADQKEGCDVLSTDR